MDIPVFSQATRAIQVTTPFGGDTLLFGKMSATEPLSRLFEFELTLFSDKGDLNADTILGKPLVVTMAAGEKMPERFFHGYVTEFAQAGFNERLHEYRASVRPWLWFLTRSADCRVFQNKSVPQIFKEVCRAAGFSDIRDGLTTTYDPWDYCVQYRESDFNFVSRLLEQEGIFYFFEHSRDKHVLVLSDDATQLASVKDYETVPYFPPAGPDIRRERDHLDHWAFQKSFQPGTFATREYDFRKPTPVLAGTATIPREHGAGCYEVFDYPGAPALQNPTALERVARVRVQELQVTQMLARGGGDAAGVTTGKLFTLSGHPRADLNMQYLVLSTSIELESDSFQTGSGVSDSQFRISLEAVSAREAYRPARNTPKPIVQGTQTAVVVGPDKEEIYTDKFGRVKVQFHWDRHGKHDETSSCWVRVAQPWAGRNWGAVQIPRIGQEVVVTFLEGDPDRPLIVGSVYNGTNLPPYTLPDHKTQSGILSRSSPNGTAENANSLRFEDKKGAEQVYLHAERNMDCMVEANDSQQVGGDRAIGVKGFHHETVGKEIEIVSENGHVKITAATSIELRVGASTLSMDSGGNISVNGKVIATSASEEQIIKGGMVYINP
jgi:type VI secretion system secreted protein VgrG